MVMGEWAEAEKYSTIQFEKSNRSKTLFSFLQLINHYRYLPFKSRQLDRFSFKIYMQILKISILYRAKPTDTEKLKAYAEEVPKHQMTVAGKHLHVEKYAIRKAR